MKADQAFEALIRTAIHGRALPEDLSAGVINVRVGPLDEVRFCIVLGPSCSVSPESETADLIVFLQPSQLEELLRGRMQSKLRYEGNDNLLSSLSAMLRPGLGAIDVRSSR